MYCYSKDPTKKKHCKQSHSVFCKGYLLVQECITSKSRPGMHWKEDTTLSAVNLMNDSWICWLMIRKLWKLWHTQLSSLGILTLRQDVSSWKHQQLLLLSFCHSAICFLGVQNQHFLHIRSFWTCSEPWSVGLTTSVWTPDVPFSCIQWVSCRV